MKKYLCFHCEWFRPECGGAKNCSYASKKDSLPVNSPEVVDKKFEELKKAKQESGGKQFIGDTDIVPSELPSGWDVLAKEDSFDRNTTWE